MAKKTKLGLQRRRRASPAGGRVRLREQFQSYARAVILEAGEDVMASQGLHAARMEEVAQKARVAVGTIYNLIGDRDALVAEILRLRHEELVLLLSRTLEEVRPLPFREQAERCLAALLDYFRTHRRFYQMVLESERSPACVHKRAAQEMVGKMRELFRELVARGVQAGALRAEVQELAPTMLMGVMREVILLDVESQHPSSPQQRAAEVLSLFVEGAGTRTTVA